MAVNDKAYEHHYCSGTSAALAPAATTAVGLVFDASQVFEAILVTMVALLSGPIESK